MPIENFIFFLPLCVVIFIAVSKFLSMAKSDYDRYRVCMKHPEYFENKSRTITQLSRIVSDQKIEINHLKRDLAIAENDDKDLNRVLSETYHVLSSLKECVLNPEDIDKCLTNLEQKEILYEDVLPFKPISSY